MVEHAGASAATPTPTTDSFRSLAVQALVDLGLRGPLAHWTTWVSARRRGRRWRCHTLASAALYRSGRVLTSKAVPPA